MKPAALLLAILLLPVTVSAGQLNNADALKGLPVNSDDLALFVTPYSRLEAVEHNTQRLVAYALEEQCRFEGIYPFLIHINIPCGNIRYRFVSSIVLF